MTKNSDDFDDSSSQKVSRSRLQNVCKAYAWWIAKDCVNLMILKVQFVTKHIRTSLTQPIFKPLDFTRLKAQTRIFMRELLINIFINSQRSTPVIGNSLNNIMFTRNRNAIEEVFIKATRLQNLSMGLVYFLSELLAKPSGEGDALDKFVKWSVGVAQETLRTGIDVVPIS